MWVLLRLKPLKRKFEPSAKIELKFNVTHFHQNEKYARLRLDTAYKDGLYPKCEEKPVNGQNKSHLMFVDDTACSFHSATESGIRSNIVEFGQNCIFEDTFGYFSFRNDRISRICQF